MRVLVTGICGFVGSSIAFALRELGDNFTIFGVDNLVRRGSERNRSLLLDQGIQVYHGDIRISSDIALLPRADWVIDAAANPSVLAGVDGKSSPLQLLESNLWGTVGILEYCRQHEAGLVLLSSSRVYSIHALAGLPMREEAAAFVLDSTPSLPPGVSLEGVEPDFSTAAPVSLYGSTKLASELLALEYGCSFQFPVWVNRCGVLAGAGQFGTADQGILTYWLNAHLRKRPLRYIGFNGKGYQSRDALHPRDLAALVMRQIRTPRVGGTRLYTVGGGNARLFSLARLTAWCDTRFGRHEIGVDSASRPFDIPWFVTDSALAAKEFDWAPEFSLEQILDEIAHHAEEHSDWLSISGAL
jgi:CDP-paratose 2-epimerase